MELYLICSPQTKLPFLEGSVTSNNVQVPNHSSISSFLSTPFGELPSAIPFKILAGKLPSSASALPMFTFLSVAFHFSITLTDVIMSSSCV